MNLFNNLEFLHIVIISFILVIFLREIRCYSLFRVKVRSQNVDEGNKILILGWGKTDENKALEKRVAGLIAAIH